MQDQRLRQLRPYQAAQHRDPGADCFELQAYDCHAGNPRTRQATLERRTERLRQRAQDLGAELRLLRWEQRAGWLAVAPLRRPRRAHCGQPVETGTVGRTLSVLGRPVRWPHSSQCAYQAVDSDASPQRTFRHSQHPCGPNSESTRVRPISSSRG